jgi:hypothetical protein
MSDTSEKPYEVIDGMIFPKIQEYPKELGDSWIQVTKFNNESAMYGVISLYLDNKHDKGTTIFSSFIRNKHPDAYISFQPTGNVDRVYTSPDLRKKGILAALGGYGRNLIFYPYEKILLDHSRSSSPAADETHARAICKALGINNKDEVRETKHFLKPQILYEVEKSPPRDAIYPCIWAEKRIWE